MIKVYTNKNKLPEGLVFQKDSESYFDSTVTELTYEEMELIKPIDNFEYLSNNKIETPYGICSIYELSTGSKTIINVLRNLDKVFDITSCGNNALNILMPILNEIGGTVVLNHTSYDQIIGDSELEFIINGKHTARGTLNLKIRISEESDKEGMAWETEL